MFPEPPGVARQLSAVVWPTVIASAVVVNTLLSGSGVGLEVGLEVGCWNCTYKELRKSKLMKEYAIDKQLNLKSHLFGWRWERRN